MPIQAPNYYGFNPPFFGGHQNVLSRQSGDRLIKNDLMQLLMTDRGERVMRPSWGAGLNRVLFEPMVPGIEYEIQEDIRKAIQDYEPRINARVRVQADQDTQTLNVFVVGVYTDMPNETFELELSFPLVKVE